MKKVLSSLVLIMVSIVLTQLARTLNYSLSAAAGHHWQLALLNLADPLEVLIGFTTAVTIGLMMLTAASNFKSWFGTVPCFLAIWLGGTGVLSFMGGSGWAISGPTLIFDAALQRTLHGTSAELFGAYGVVSFLASLFGTFALSKLLLGDPGSLIKVGGSNDISSARLTGKRRSIKRVSDGNIVDINSDRQTG